ncbi:MAG: hypothetical protein CMK02_07405 [Polycyclovorans sp.]|nr:hypothetical protein [Polycyclovorans sp.]|tara:strand:- start:3074 stop:3694 length:621 start_codon:yes stop_codon:yes gene_type:complete
MNFSVPLILFAALSLSPSIVSAQSAAELLEAARAQSKEIEELKGVMDGPDRNLRLAAFDAMVAGENSLYRDIAVEAGLASSDSLLRARALNHAIGSVNSLVITLSVDTSASKTIQELTTKYLAENRQLLTLTLSKKTSSASGVNGALSNDYRGGAGGTFEVLGLQMMFSAPYNYITGELTLKDDAVLTGPVSTSEGHRFIGTARLR